jgi:hypothetical protein
MKEFSIRPLVYQSGSALMIILALILLAFTASLATFLPSLNRDAKTANANAAVLAQAKAALIAYAVSAGSMNSCSNGSTDCERPGDFPCPDMSADTVDYGKEGVAGASSCGNIQGTTGQANRLGRLPWKTLGLPSLRDADGNRLWYAVSNKFKDHFRFTPLNSDTFGTITIRDSNGTVTNDGFTPTGAIAVIIAPGAPIKRQDGHQQKRTNNAAIEYLDIATINGVTEDNATFVDGSAANGFIQGPIKDASGNIISNDQMVFITYEDIMPLIEKRVAGEVLRATAQVGYPRPADFNDPSCLGNTSVLATNTTACPSLASGDTCGRLPINTASGIGKIWGNTDIPRGAAGGFNSWFQINGWRELVFYALPGSCNGSNGLLSITPALPTLPNNALVLVAGRRLATQRRSSNAEKANSNNFFEAGNGSSVTYTNAGRSATFNDTILAQ